MNKSNRIHARIQEFLSYGGGGGGGRGPTARKQSGQCFFSHQLISTYFTVYRVDPMVLLQRGGGGPTCSRGWGCPKKTHITCDFPGGEVRTPYPTPPPLWIRTWGSLTPLFPYRIMVYQNLNKTEKYHPTTTKRKKAISCWSR